MMRAIGAFPRSHELSLFIDPLVSLPSVFIKKICNSFNFNTVHFSGFVNAVLDKYFNIFGVHKKKIKIKKYYHEIVLEDTCTCIKVVY
jgi:hypothetical protein